MPVLLLACALHQNRRAAHQFEDVNRSGSLRYRSYRVAELMEHGEDPGPELQEMAAIRESLRAAYPQAVAGTDSSWQQFSDRISTDGRAEWETTTQMAQASDHLTAAIEAQAQSQEKRVSLLLGIGLLGLAVSLLGTSRLLGRLRLSREKQSRLTAILDTSTDLISLADASGHYSYLNDAFRKVLSLEDDADIAPLHVLDGHVPWSRERLQYEAWPAVLRDGFWQGEAAIRSGDHREIPLSLLLLTHRAEDGSVKYLSTIARDITDRKTAEVALKRSEDRLRRLHEVTTARALTLAEKMESILHLGQEFFALDVGFVSRVEAGKFTVLHSLDPNYLHSSGFICDLPETYCSRVIAAGEVQAVSCASASDWRNLPAYSLFGLEAYLGAPLWVKDVLSGTLCFASKASRPEEFADSDLEILRLMAQWISGEMAREEDDGRIEAYSTVLKFQMAELEKANRELETLATQDGLTGILNHRAFQERLSEEFVRTARYGTPLALVMLDVDSFKQYNDAFGHPAGDIVLRAVANLLGENARETDVVARYGGEEFVLLLPQTDSRGAETIAERVRRAIELAPWPQRCVTASLGVAVLTPAMKDGGDLIAAADTALYRSKAGGRNRVTVADCPRCDASPRIPVK